MSSPSGAKAAHDLAMNDRRAYSLFAEVISWANILSMQEEKHSLSILYVASLQFLSFRVLEFPLQQPIQQAFQAPHLPEKVLVCQLLALLMQVNGQAEQALHMGRPGALGILFSHRLEVTQLVSQAQLVPVGRGFHLRCIAITNPHFGHVVAHDFLDYIHTAVETDHMHDGILGAKHPLPPVLPIHPAARLVRINHCTFSNLLYQRLHCLQSLPTSTPHDLVNARTVSLLLQEMEQLQQQVGELAERMDFTERLLTQQRERERLSKGS